MPPLTSKQTDRLRYVAACGPVFRETADEDLERLRLVRPFNGMPLVVEITDEAEQTTAGEGGSNHSSTLSDLLEACQVALQAVSKSRWCQNEYGCDRCHGCRQYRRMTELVTRATGEQLAQRGVAFARPR